MFGSWYFAKVLLDDRASQPEFEYDRVILGRRAFQYLTVFKAKEETWDFYNSFLSISFDKCIGHLLRFKL